MEHKLDTMADALADLGFDDQAVLSHEAAKELTRLRAENKRLREALRPFALLDLEGTTKGPIFGRNRTIVTREDVLAARAALGEDS